MSISLAPSATEASISRELGFERREAVREGGGDGGDRDAGALERRRRRSRRRRGRRRRRRAGCRSSPTPRPSRISLRTGWRALAQSRSTRPGVSSELSVVRSIRVMALSSQAACQSFLTVRRAPMVAARRSSAERFMRMRLDPVEIERKAGIALVQRAAWAAGRAGDRQLGDS